MDPVTAIGLASGILAFVEISAKIISGTLEVARSGSLAENAHVGAIVDDLQQAAGELQERLPDHSRHAESLNGLASECRSVADELQELLQKLKVDCGSPKWNAIKVTIHSMRKRGDVAQLEGRLEKCRSQILLRLMMILDERQTSVQVQLSGIESKSASRSANIVHQLDRLRHDILSATENQKNNHGRSEENSKDSDQSILLQKLSTSVDALLDGSRGPSPDVRVLKQLYFPGVYSREDNMETASDRTFRWILEDGFDERLGEDDLKPGDNGRNSAGDNFKDPEDTRSDKSEKEKPATHMKKKERGETDEEKQRRIAKENRVKARAKFTTWLERDSGVFHISGKPGSGKSTLMKFIHGQPETIERLIVWAGNKQLVFGHFFFFKAGGKLQKSLEGLQRSILFEALKQCPELIKHVFPEAYRAFSSNPAASSIDELYFRPRELDQAINMLASVPTAMGYRICFFIDGLDEYEDTNADELHHERLAEQLCSWATNSDVKILVSSRPYRAFQEAFLDERRIRIQDLTDIDITLFARKMFEEDKSFDQVRPYYQRLVNKVVQDSAGVFLWARLTMRSLIMATRRNCSPEFLEQQLDQTPRSINALYAQLLASINPIDRDSAYRLLLFVARLAEADVEVLALALTWMDSLQNPNFPMCSEPRAYTTEEVELRRNSVRQDLENCTKGLLEITTHTDSSCRSTTDTVRFFHRTILDFVRESEVFRQVSAKYPGLGDEKMTIRMFLAELWYIKIPHRRHELLNRHFGRMPPSQTRDNYLDALERVVSYHNANGTLSIGIATHHPYGYSHMYRQQTSSQMYRTKASFLHWAASILDDPEYVIKKLKEKPHLLHHRDYLSLVLSATFSNETRWSDTRLTPFFQLGISPNERINVYKISFRRELLSPKSCWAVFCTFYAMHNTGRLCESDRACYLATQLEDFLSTGEVDINCVILLNTCGDGWRWRYHDDEPEPKEPGVTHYIYLKDLISRLSSDNHVAISHLVSASNWSLWKSLKNIWSYSPPPENDLSALTSTYPVCDDELLFSKETHVVSLVWENEKIERTDFEITLY